MKKTYTDINCISGHLDEDIVGQLLVKLNEGYSILHLTTTPISVGNDSKLTWRTHFSAILVKEVYN